jgi:hypothetical protein
MTFTEAAVEVLRLVGKPLHYKKITEIAIERNLLSHVGKTPETTMATRLAMVVKKDRGDAPLIKVKPGIFALREFPEEALSQIEEDPNLEIPDELVEDEAEEAATEETRRAARAEHRPPGAEVFPEEADDDDPIFSKLEEAEGDEAGARRRGKRRRRGRKGREGEEAAPNGNAQRPEAQGRGDGRQGRNRERERERFGDRDRDRGRAAPAEVSGNWNRTPEKGDAAGADLAETIRDILERGPRRSKRARAIADELVRRRRLSGTGDALAPTVAAAVRSDVARRSSSGGRARFRIEGDAISLMDWDLSNEAVRAEREAARTAARQRDAARRDFLQRLGDLPTSSLMELLATWLNAMGVGALRGVKREGSPPGTYHLAGAMSQGPISLPLAIVVVRKGGVTRDMVVDVRGSLHHYGEARAAWILSLQGAQADAKREAAAPHTVPVSIVDGKDLAKAMERAGVGLKVFQLPMLVPDLELLDALRGPGFSSMPEILEVEPPVEASDDEGDDLAPDAAEDAEETGRRRRRRRGRGRGAAAAELGASDEEALDAEESEEPGEPAEPEEPSERDDLDDSDREEAEDYVRDDYEDEDDEDEDEVRDLGDDEDDEDEVDEVDEDDEDDEDEDDRDIDDAEFDRDHEEDEHDPDDEDAEFDRDHDDEDEDEDDEED